MRELLRQSAFGCWFGAGLLSTLGSEISRIGLFLYLFHQRGAVFDLALLLVLKTLPGVVVAPFAGLLVDRLNKPRVMIACELAQVVVLLVVLRWPTLGVLYLAAGLQSATSAFFEPARRAVLPQVVTASEVPSANGLDMSARNSTLFLGPVLGAEIFLWGGLLAVLWVDAASFLVSALLLRRIIRSSASASAGPAGGASQMLREAGASQMLREAGASQILREARTGWQYVHQHPLVLHLTSLFALSMLCSGMWMPLAPFFIRDVLGASDRVLGFQIAVFGIGGVCGGLLAARLLPRVAAGWVLFLALLLESLQLLAYALVPQLVLSHLILFGWGIAVSLIAVAAHSILQTQVDGRFLGRVFALVNSAENLALLAAMGLAMILGSWWSSYSIFLTAGFFYLGSVALSSLTPGGRVLLLTR